MIGVVALLRLALRILTGFALVPAIYLIFGLLGGLIPGRAAQIGVAADPPGNEIRIGLARGPIHYDFLLPIDAELIARFDFATSQGVPLGDPNARWLVLGWGAAEFYTSTGTLGDISAGPVFHAIAGDNSVLRLDAAGSLDGVPGIRFITLTPGQYQALLTGILASFARDGAGNVIASAEAGFGLTDAFFVGSGQFNIVYTCNSWIGAQLRGAGLPMGFWTPIPQAVDLSLWRIGLSG